MQGFPVGYEVPQPMPRARSRFQFANEQTSPPHPGTHPLSQTQAPGHPQQYLGFPEQAPTPAPGYRVFGSMDANQDGHAMGYQGYSVVGQGFSAGQGPNHPPEVKQVSHSIVLDGAEGRGRGVGSKDIEGKDLVSRLDEKIQREDAASNDSHVWMVKKNGHKIIHDNDDM
jgi:hypothetical protein